MTLEKLLLSDSDQLYCKICSEDINWLNASIDISFALAGMERNPISRLTLLTQCRCGTSSQTEKKLVYNFASNIIHFDPMPESDGYWEDGNICNLTEDRLNKLLHFIENKSFVNLIRENKWTSELVNGE